MMLLLVVVMLLVVRLYTVESVRLLLLLLLLMMVTMLLPLLLLLLLAVLLFVAEVTTDLVPIATVDVLDVDPEFEFESNRLVVVPERIPSHDTALRTTVMVVVDAASDMNTVVVEVDPPLNDDEMRERVSLVIFCVTVTVTADRVTIEAGHEDLVSAETVLNTVLVDTMVEVLGLIVEHD